MPPMGPSLAAAGAVALVVSLAFAFVAHSRPLTRSLISADLYTERGTFSYSALAPVGTVYQHPVLRAPDPIFTKLVHRLEIGFRYEASSKSPLGRR